MSITLAVVSICIPLLIVMWIYAFIEIRQRKKAKIAIFAGA